MAVKFLIRCEAVLMADAAARERERAPATPEQSNPIQTNPRLTIPLALRLSFLFRRSATSYPSCPTVLGRSAFSDHHLSH